MSKTILITGASRGFGKLWAQAFLKRGDKVIATARNLDSLKDLTAQFGDAILAIKLDVNNRAECFAAVKKAQEHFGKIDVLINNAAMVFSVQLKRPLKNRPAIRWKQMFSDSYG